MKKPAICLFYLILGFIAFNSACTKEAERDFPRVKTLAATDINKDGATIHAKILNYNSVNISEYGFNVFKAEPSASTFIGNIITNDIDESGVFKTIIETGLKRDYTYYYQAYAISEPIKTIGNSISFLSQGSKPPDIINFEPKNGQVGDTLLITCNNTIGDIAEFSIKFNDSKANIISFSGTSITVIVPYNLIDEVNTVTVELYGNISTFEDKFTLLTVSIDSFFPTEVRSGDLVTIYGSNFCLKKERNIVRFNNTNAIVISATSSSLVVAAPQLENIECEISVSIYSQSATAPDFIKMLKSLVVWQQIANFPGGKAYKVGAFSIGDYGYAGLGTQINHNYINKFWKYNPSSDSWSQMVDFPGETRVLPYAFTINNKGYVGGGFDYDGPSRNTLKDFYSYDPTINTWSLAANYPGAINNDALGPAGVIANIGYLAVTQEDFYKFSDDPTNWEKISMGSTKIYTHSASFTIDSKIYFICGIDTDYNPGIWKNDVLAYDTSTEIWEKKNDFPGGARYGGKGFIIDGNAYFGMGYYKGEYYKDIWKYYPDTDAWIFHSNIPGPPRICAIAFVIGHKAYIGTGSSNNGLLNDMYFFNPSK